MKTVSLITRRTWLAPTVSLVLLWGGTPSQAQSTGSEIRRHGDAFSEKVSGFFGRVFGGGNRQPAPAPVYPQAAPSSQYQTTSPQQPAYRYAPSSNSAGQRSSASAQRPTYTQAPVASSPAKKTKTTPSVAAKRSTTSTKSTVAKKRPQPEPERPVYTSTKRSKTEDTVPSYSSKSSSTQETVVTAPPPAPKDEPAKTYTSLSPSTSKSTTTDVFPLPGKSPESTPKKESTSTAPSSPAGQEFPKGTATSKPGRVVSPYEPFNELDVQGLPSGSLALDPTTQKVFKIP